MIFDDRRHAGILLAKELDVYRGHAGTLVLALPRGGVVVGLEMALALHVVLGVFITRKVGLPESPEYAIGTVSETGSLYLNPEATGYLNESREDVGGLIEAQRHEILRHQILYRHGRTLPLIQDHTVIVIDDGIATGSTFFATIEAIRKLSPGRLAAAIQCRLGLRPTRCAPWWTTVLSWRRRNRLALLASSIRTSNKLMTTRSSVAWNRRSGPIMSPRTCWGAQASSDSRPPVEGVMARHAG